VAAKIFELGLRFFSTDIDYVVRYLNFLIGKCDEASKTFVLSIPQMAYVKTSTDARALFEKSVGSLEAEKARPIWQRWLQYQMGVADLATIIKLDKRVAEAYPKGEIYFLRLEAFMN
jgi:cleavage stimulation factor subunit 3